MLIEKVYQCVVHAKTNQGYEKKFCKLNPNSGIMALKCPHTIQQIIAKHRKQKACAVSKVLVKLGLFFQQPCYTKINCHAGNTDNAEFQKLEYYIIHVHV